MNKFKIASIYNKFYENSHASFPASVVWEKAPSVNIFAAEKG